MRARARVAAAFKLINTITWQLLRNKNKEIRNSILYKYNYYI